MGYDAETVPPSDAAIRPADGAALREIWRGFGSTVALVATELEGERFAMLATAVSSVSLDPPALLICVNRSASAYPALLERQAFSLGIMPHSAHGVAAAVADAAGAERFSHGDWRVLAQPGQPLDRLPWLGEAQATMFCQVENQVDHGTHTIFIARVVSTAGQFAADPLIYCDGRFGRFEDVAQ